MTGYRLPRAVVYTPPRNREERLTDIATLTNNLLINRMLGTVVGDNVNKPRLYRPGALDLVGRLPEVCPDCGVSWSNVNSSHIVNLRDVLAHMRAAPPGEPTGALNVCVDCPKCGDAFPKHIEYLGKLVTS